MKFDSDVLDPKLDAYYGPAHNEDETMAPEYMNDWLMRDMELVNNYQPQLVWFDWWIEQPALTPYRKSFAAFYYNKAKDWNKEVVINYKNSSYPDGVAVLDLERGKLGEIKPQAWQTDDAIGNQSKGKTTTKTKKNTPKEKTKKNKNNNKNKKLLLNIGPKSDGTITE